MAWALTFSAHFPLVEPAESSVQPQAELLQSHCNRTETPSLFFMTQLWRKER